MFWCLTIFCCNAKQPPWIEPGSIETKIIQLSVQGREAAHRICDVRPCWYKRPLREGR
jgi:hypothetical protein